LWKWGGRQRGFFKSGDWSSGGTCTKNYVGQVVADFLMIETDGFIYIPCLLKEEEKKQNK